MSALVKFVIKLTQGNLPHDIEIVEEQLARRRVVFVHHDRLVWIGETGNPGRVAPVELNEAGVLLVLDQYFEFHKYIDKGKTTHCDCPAKVARALLARKGRWRLPKLTMVTSAPTMRPDGTVINNPGFDPATGVFFHPQGVEYPVIPDAPTWNDARAALDTIIDLVREVPFVVHEEYGAVNRAVFLAAFLTAAARPVFPFTPIFAFDSPAPGSGKTMLCDALSGLQTGAPAGVMAQGPEDDETEKRLVTSLRHGDTIIVLDNCSRAIEGDLLCQIATSPALKVRILGESNRVEAPNNAMLLLNGNNLLVSGDMVRRVLRCTIDPRVENPESRKFTTERPDYRMMKNRPEYVAAALTVLRAFHAAGMPRQCDETQGFDVWSRWVRDTLIWLGEPDPWLVTAETRKEDPERTKLLAVLEQWFLAFSDAKVRVQDIMERALAIKEDNGRRSFVNEPLKDALTAVAPDHDGYLNKLKLSQWIGRRKHRVIGGYQIRPAGNLHGYPYWQVVQE